MGKQSSRKSARRNGVTYREDIRVLKQQVAKLTEDFANYRDFVAGLIGQNCEDIGALQEKVGIVTAATAGISDVVGPDKVSDALAARRAARDAAAAASVDGPAVPVAPAAEN